MRDAIAAYAVVVVIVLPVVKACLMMWLVKRASFAGQSVHWQIGPFSYLSIKERNHAMELGRDPSTRELGLPSRFDQPTE